MKGDEKEWKKTKRDEKEWKNKGWGDKKKGEKWREELVKEWNVISENKNKNKNKNKKTYLNCKTGRVKEPKKNEKS